jgi:putative secretion ATPase (PEP-CTERM system associated)
MYRQFYKLTGSPFQLSPDPEFFFGSRGHKRALAYLQYGVQQGEGFIAITGDIGAGKTTLARSLLAHLDTSKYVAGQVVSTQMDAGDVLRSVAASFGVTIKGRDKASILFAIEGFLTMAAMQRRRALLIVDEAQNLTLRALEELRMLSNFQVENRALLQSFLIGQPQLRPILQRPELQQLRQRIIASYHLGPIDREETQAYVEHRLKHVGSNGDPRFEPAAFDEIFRITHGIPRRINTLCNRVLLAGSLADKHVLDGSDVLSAAAEIEEELGGYVPPPDVMPTRGAVHQRRGAEPAEESAIFSQLDARLTRVESTVSATANAVRQMVRDVRGEKDELETVR